MGGGTIDKLSKLSPEKIVKYQKAKIIDISKHNKIKDINS